MRCFFLFPASLLRKGAWACHYADSFRQSCHVRHQTRMQPPSYGGPFAGRLGLRALRLDEEVLRLHELNGRMEQDLDQLHKVVAEARPVLLAEGREGCGEGLLD